MPMRIASFVPKRLASRKIDSSKSNSIYGNKGHKEWRAAVLLRDNWQCCSCRRICGGRGEAQADHIVPLVQGGARFDLENGQCLCPSCHSRKTARENA